MNYGETLAYWYLRLNGFIPLRNFVLHPLSKAESKQATDSDLLAVLFPHVYEEIGGQPNDWDHILKDWGFLPENEIIGLIVEVKTGKEIHGADVVKAFSEEQNRQAIHRLGMVENANSVVVELKGERIARRDAYCIGKLLFTPSKREGLWLNIMLREAECFLQERLNKYSDPKTQARMFFPDELMQYFVWKAGRDERRRKGADTVSEAG